jgi:hypothetical protein
MCASLARGADIVIVRHPSFNRQRAVEVFTQAGPENFARAFIQARRRERGLDIAPDRSQLRLQIFVGMLGTHQGENFLGIPSFAVPLIGLPTPEIALFKWLRNRGMVEVQIYAFDASSVAFAQKTPHRTIEAGRLHAAPRHQLHDQRPRGARTAAVVI